MGPFNQSFSNWIRMKRYFKLFLWFYICQYGNSKHFLIETYDEPGEYGRDYGNDVKIGGGVGRDVKTSGTGNQVNVGGNVGRDVETRGKGNAVGIGGDTGRDVRTSGNSLNSKSVGNDLTIGGHGNQANIGRRRRF